MTDEEREEADELVRAVQSLSAALYSVRARQRVLNAKLHGPDLMTPQNRILWNVRGEDIDEIVLHDATVHVEQMHDRCWWIGVSLSGERYWAGNFTCDSRGRMSFTEQECDLVWDDDRSHDEWKDPASASGGAV